jgi:hypothetical protein
VETKASGSVGWAVERNKLVLSYQGDGVGRGPALNVTSRNRQSVNTTGPVARTCSKVGTGGGGGLAIFSLPVRIKLALRGHRVVYVSNLVGPRDRSLRVTALVDRLLALANHHGYTIVATAATTKLIEVYERNGFILARPHSRRSRQMYRPPNAPRYRRKKD